MPTLTIGKKQIEAKIAFKFDRRANDRYKGTQEGASGFDNIYQGLLSYDLSMLLAFWDCATAYLKKDQPSLDAIEEALEEIGEEGGVEKLYNEAFTALDKSGFFSPKVKDFWKNIENLEKMVDSNNEQEMKQAKEGKKLFLEKRKALTA
jgi:hypothetical protein